MLKDGSRGREMSPQRHFGGSKILLRLSNRTKTCSSESWQGNDAGFKAEFVLGCMSQNPTNWHRLAFIFFF